MNKQTKNANHIVIVEDLTKIFENTKTVSSIFEDLNPTEELQKSLNTLQDNVIGLFKHYRLKDYEMVIKNEDGWLTTILIGKLGGLTTTHIGADQGKLVMFEKGENITSLKKNPFKLQELINEIQK